MEATTSSVQPVDAPAIITSPPKSPFKFETQCFDETETQLSHACDLADEAQRNLALISQASAESLPSTSIRPLPAPLPIVPSNQPNFNTETQSFDVTETQIIKAGEIADAAQCYCDENVQWKTRLREQVNPSKSQNIVQSILNDFDISPPGPSTTTREEASAAQFLSPPLVFQRNAQRTYSRLKPQKRQKKSSRKLHFEHLESDSGSESDHETSTDAAAALNETLADEDNTIDIDLNCSRNIIDNIANLSTFFTQSSQDEDSSDAPIDLLISEAIDRANYYTIELRDDGAQQEPELFGVINYECNLFGDLLELDDSKSAPDEMEAAEPPAVTPIEEKSLLDMDVDLFMNINSPQIDASVARTRLVNASSTPVSRPIRARNLHETDRDDCEFESNPKRLRFDGFESAPAIEKGFSTARGDAIKVSSNGIRNSANIFADIEAELMADKQLSSILTADEAIASNFKPQVKGVAFKAPAFANATGFQTGTGKSIAISDKNLKKFSKLYEETSDEDLSRQTVIDALPSTSSLVASHQPAAGGFTTGRGSSIKVSDKALQQSTEIFNQIQNEDISKLFDSKLVVGNGAEVNENKENSIGPDGGFTTARGSTISISAKSMQKMAGLFDDVYTGVAEDGEGDNPPVNVVPAADTKRVALKNMHLRNSSTLTRDVVDCLGASASAIDSLRDSANAAFNGFSTARGSKIHLPESSLAMSMRLFQNIEDEVNRECQSPKPTRRIDGQGIPSNASDCFKTPTNSTFLNSFNTSTPVGPSSSVTTEGKDQCSTPKTLERLKSAEDSVRFLEELDNIGFEDMFPSDDIMSASQREHDRRVPKKTCLANKFEHLEDDEEHTAGPPSNEDQAKPVAHPGVVPPNVINDRRLAFVDQQQSNKHKTAAVKPLPGALLLTKLTSLRRQLLSFGAPRNTTAAELKALGVTESVLSFHPSKVDTFEFKMWEFYPLQTCLENVRGIAIGDNMSLIMNDRCTAGVTEITSCFLSGPTVDPKLIPDNWISNALKWIMWKLVSLEQRFPNEFAGKAVSPENVLLQLKYRYDREIDRAERPALRRIVERDDAAARRMVLFVSDIRKAEGSLDYCMELSDGWYAIGAYIDGVLAHAVTSKKIEIGTKLMIQGAELVGSEEACSPLEVFYLPVDLILLNI